MPEKPARKIATTDRVDLAALLDFVRPRHRMILVTPAGTAGLSSRP